MGGASTIVGGASNSTNASQELSFIGGGQDNCIEGKGWNFIGGGAGNTAKGYIQTIGGGNCNSIDDGEASIIGGGQCNYAGGNVASTLGGFQNCSFGTFDVIVGGKGHWSKGGSFQFIGGGLVNCIEPEGDCQFNAILSGCTNLIAGSSVASSIAGGINNGVFSPQSFIGGGKSNQAKGLSFNTIAGGFSNIILGACANIIGGGRNNCIDGNGDNDYNSILGGCCNWITCNAACSTIVGGSCNTTLTNHTVLGGCYNRAEGPGDTVFGFCNTSTSAGKGQIIVGFRNTSSGQYNLIGGCNNNVEGTGGAAKSNPDWNVVVGCNNNVLMTPSSLMAGEDNTFDDIKNAAMWGTSNCIYSISSNASMGGASNIITKTTNSSIISGRLNSVSGSFDDGAGKGYCLNDNSAILSGMCNIIQTRAQATYKPTDSDYGQNIIGAGTCNTIESFVIDSFIGSGKCNVISNCIQVQDEGGSTADRTNCGNAIVGGLKNAICGYKGKFPQNFIGGGNLNQILQGSSSFYDASNMGMNSIVGGFCNTITDTQQDLASGGELCYISNNFIGGGCRNQISGSRGRNSVVGGTCNVITGNCVQQAAILGGYGNEIKKTGTNDPNCSTIIGSDRANNIHENSHIIGLSQYTTAANHTTYVCNLCVVGTLAKAAGSFKIDHPTPSKSSTHNLIHSFVESPTAGDNIYRYSVTTVNNKAEITLPNYYKDLNKDNQIWVSADGHFGQAFGLINLETTILTITSNQDGKYNVLLIGTRKDKDANKYWKGVETLKNEEETTNYNKKQLDSL